METEFKASRFEAGPIGGIETVSRELAKYYPPRAAHSNELPDQPVVM
jgi:uncharacterized membrane protein